MQTICGYFSDDLIKCDTSHQIQALQYASEARYDQPVVIDEVQDLLRAVQLISRYLTMDQQPESLLPPKQTLTELFYQKYPEHDIFSFELQLAQQFQPWLLIQPLTEFLEILLGGSIFFNSQEQLAALLHFDQLLRQIATVYLINMPQILLKTSRLPVYERRNYILASVSSCFSLFALITKASPELLRLRNPPDEYKNEFTIYKSVPTEEIVCVFLQSACAVIADFTCTIDKLVVFGQEFVDYCHIYTLFFLEQLISKALYLGVPLQNEEMRDLISYTIGYAAGDICQRKQIIALTILQELDLNQDNCDYQLLATTMAYNLFRNGYLQVRTRYIAESQLAVLAIIEKASRTLGQFVIYLCQDLDFTLYDDFSLKAKRKYRVDNHRIVSSDSESSEPQPTNETALVAYSEIYSKTVIPANPSDPFRSRSPSPGIKFLDSDDSPVKAHDEECESLAFKINGPANVPANFVMHFLLYIICKYGEGAFHSSRALQLHLRHPEGNKDRTHYNVPDGHSVNFEELNKVTLQQVQNLRKTHQERLAELHAYDERVLQEIAKSSKYDNISKARLFTAQEQFALRDAQLEKNYTLLKTKTGREAFTTRFAQDETYRSGMTLKQTNKTAYQIISSIDDRYELLFIRFAMQIVANICVISRNSPSRYFKLVLQAVDIPYILGVLSFAKTPETSYAALQLVFALLAFPGAGSRLFASFVSAGLFECLCDVNSHHNAYAALFICRLLGGEAEVASGAHSDLRSGGRVAEIHLSTQEITYLVELTINSFVLLFCEFQDANLSQSSGIALRALVYLIVHYGARVGPVHYIIEAGAFTRLLQCFLSILAPRQHHFQYHVVLAVYGIFGLPRRYAASRLCYDTGIFRAVVALCEAKFCGDFKIQPVDLVLIRLLTDVVQYADQKMQSFAQTQTKLQECFCKCYRTWQASLNMRPHDDQSAAVLPGSDFYSPPAVVPRGNVFEVENYGSENAARTSSRLIYHSRLSPSRYRVNIIDVQNKIHNSEEDNIVFMESAVAEGDELAQFMNLSSDARYLLHCNFTTTFLAFFRALYPNLNNHFAIVSTAALTDAKLPLTGRLSVHRPSSGMTPKIGMKIPIVLPNLAGSQKSQDANNVNLYVSAENCLTVLQAQAQNLKESLIILQAGYSEDFVDSDKNFIKNAIDVLSDRIDMLRRSGEALELGVAKNDVIGEAQFMSLLD